MKRMEERKFEICSHLTEFVEYTQSNSILDFQEITETHLGIIRRNDNRKSRQFSLETNHILAGYVIGYSFCKLDTIILELNKAPTFRCYYYDTDAVHP